jgi:hypothetical protein
MKTKTYTYEANGFIKGQIQAKNKQEVKNHVLGIVELFCPTRGLDYMKIERVKE